MQIMEPDARNSRDARFDEFHGIKQVQQWRVMQACLRTDANVSRELLADRLHRSIQRDGGAEQLSLALTGAHYSDMAAAA